MRLCRPYLERRGLLEERFKLVLRAVQRRELHQRSRKERGVCLGVAVDDVLDLDDSVDVELKPPTAAQVRPATGRDRPGRFGVPLNDRVVNDSELGCFCAGLCHAGMRTASGSPRVHIRASTSKAGSAPLRNARQRLRRARAGLRSCPLFAASRRRSARVRATAPTRAYTLGACARARCAAAACRVSTYYHRRIPQECVRACVRISTMYSSESMRSSPKLLSCRSESARSSCRSRQ